MGAGMPRILISYRRADSDAIAGRIRDQLASRYGSDSVFMDIDSVPAGVDFREQIKSEILKDDIVLAIIGPRWRGPRRRGSARIDDADDFVRVELETALERSIPVIPVLVEGMKMPRPEQHPDSLRELAFRNAATVDARQDFHQHVDRLMRSVDRMVGSKANLRLRIRSLLRPLPRAFIPISLSALILLAGLTFLLNAGGRSVCGVWRELPFCARTIDCSFTEDFARCVDQGRTGGSR
jgi:hypothetical protein